MEYVKVIQTSELPKYVDALKKEMQRKLYSENEIARRARFWLKLLDYSNNKPIQEFNEEFRQSFITDVFATEMENRDSMYKITRAINLISDYVSFGVIFRQYCTPKTTFSEEFKECFESFIAAEKGRNLATGSIKSIHSRLLRFHDYLIDIGIRKFNQITVNVISTYILSFARYSTTYTSESLRTLRRLFDHAYKEKYCTESLSYCIPHVKNLRQQKLPNVFTADEINRILDSTDQNNPIGKRNYAIIMLAVMTGLRSSDIKALCFKNIDWDKKTINITQSKTGKSLSLPLSENAGWAIIEYLKHGRPETDCQFIFVSHRYPYGELATICNILPRQMRKAGIKSPANKRVGMHSFRHSLATRMLEADVPLPVVSQTLGHADINSTEVYLRISIKQLAKCGLEVDL